MADREELRGEILRWISGGLDAPVDDERFERVARGVFEYQFGGNEPYRRYCERRGVTPAALTSWCEIPPVPTAAFKEAALLVGRGEDAEIVFRTSGTTEGVERRGAHHVRDLALYRASALANFRAHVLPDGSRITMLVLGPSPELAPDSSLSWMFELLRRELGMPESGYYVDANGLRLEPLLEALHGAESRDRPVAILGTAAALAHLLDALEERDRLELPLGTRVMETGGFKGKRREIPRERFYRMLVDRLGVSELSIVSEYGMTEMCSQFYDNVLARRAKGRPPDLRHKVVPPWVRTRILDAETLESVPHGRLGVLVHYDLANLDSVMAIQTDDLGVSAPEGFEIMGRASGAELRGCSIAMDRWLTAQS